MSHERVSHSQSLAETPRIDIYADQNAELTQLLDRCANGDSHAFKRVYALTAPKLTAITLKMVRDEQLTFDIMQQSYLKIWEKAGTYDPNKGKAFSWMLVVTRNKSLDCLRKLKREGYSDELTDLIEDETAQSDDRAKAWMLRRLIAPYLDKLSPQTTQAVLLSAVHGLSSREIGERLNVPTNTAKSWVRRGLQKLRVDLDVRDISELI